MLVIYQRVNSKRVDSGISHVLQDLHSSFIYCYWEGIRIPRHVSTTLTFNHFLLHRHPSPFTPFFGRACNWFKKTDPPLTGMVQTWRHGESKGNAIPPRKCQALFEGLLRDHDGWWLITSFYRPSFLEGWHLGVALGALKCPWPVMLSTEVKA